ncbi:hypothetical protein BLNAU_159 [Blattamonas nauphoetae]|uniref:Chromatin assembly factor 1 subunit A dimerization domain-containing protein n=1 Tax=Blattamonas nauphoetae TaxID=2049346 RepID=A0ABQ9YM73_9EUKA|nr:hypothetical protein BLNAU_159 [Blattamonas nauphoetae]
MYPVSIQRDPMIVRVKKPDPSKALFGTTIGFGSPPHGNNDGDDENEQGDDLGSSDDSDDSDFEDRLLDQPMNIRRAERKIQRTGADDGRVTSVLALSVRLNWMKQDTKFPSSFLMTSTDNLVTPNEATIWDHFQDVNYKPALVVVVSAQKPTKRFKNFKLFHFHRDESSFTFSGIFNKTSAVVDALHPFRKDPLVDYDVDDDDEWEEEKETVMASDEWKSEQKAIKAKAAREEAKRKRKEKRRLEKEAAKAAQKRPDEQRDDDEVDLDEDSSSSDLNPNLDEYETDEDEQFEAVSPRVSRTHINTIFGAGLQEDSSEDDSDFTDEGSSDGSSASDMEDGDFEQGMMKDEELEHHQPTPSHTPQGNTAQKRRVFVEDDSEEYETMITPTTGKRTQLRIIQDDDDSDSDAIDNYSSEDLAKSPPLELFSQSTSDQMKSDPDPKAQTTEFLRSFLSMFDSEPKAHPKTSLSPSPTPKDIGADSSFSYSTKQFEKEGATQALRLLKNDTERMRSTKKDSFIDESDDSEKTGRMIGSLLFYRSKCSIMTQMQIISVSKNYDMDDRQIKYVQKTRVPVAVMHTQQTDNSDPSSSHQRIPLEQIPLSLDQTQSSQTGWKYVVQDQPKNIPVQDGDAHAFFSLLKTLSNYSIIPIPKSEQKRKERAKRNLEKEQQRREKEERKMERLRLREEKKQQELTPKLVLSSLPGTGLNYTVSLPISQTLTNPLSPFSSQLTSAVSRIPKSAMRLLKGDMLKEFVRMADGTKHRDAVFDLFEQKHPLYKNRLRRVKLQHILKSVMFKSKDKKYRVCREFRTQFGLDELDEEEEGDSDFLKDERELPDFILTALEEEEPPIEPLDSFLDKEKEESGEMGPTELSHSLKAHANCSLIPLESLTMPELLHLRNQCVQIFRLIETLDAINGNRKWKEMEQLNDPVLISEGEKVRENGHIIPQVAVSSEPLVNSAFLSPYAFTPAVLGTDSNAGVDGDTTPNENSPTSSPKLSNGNMSTLPTKNVTFILPDLLSTLLHPTKKTGFGVVGQDEMTTPANTTELVPEKKEEQPIKRRSSHTHSSTRNRATGITPPASEETAKDKQIKSLERSIRAKKLDLKRALALGIDTTELELTLEQDFSEMNQLVQVSPKLEQEVVAPPVIDKDTPPTQPAIEPRPVQPPPVTALMSVLEPPRPVPKPKEKKRITPIKME